MLAQEDVVSKHELDMGGATYEPIKIPNKIPNEYKSLFDLYFNAQEMKWVNWMNT